MSKKTMLLALSVASVAMFALPSVASATAWHISQTGNFTVHGGAAQLSTTSGTTLNCSTVTSTAATSYTSTTGGTLRLLFHGCNSSGFNCTTPGQPSGTITTEQLTFHNVMLSPNTPGILITPGPKVFAHFVCAIVTIEVKGNGILGHVEKACGSTDTEAGLRFVAPVHGHQDFTTVTSVTYGLTRNAEPAAENVTATATFPGARTINCT